LQNIVTSQVVLVVTSFYRPLSVGNNVVKMWHMLDPRSGRTLERRQEKRLFAYALAAGAGMLAAGTPAEAGVIYVNPTDQTYTNIGFQLDLNGDSVNDVTFTNAGYSFYWRILKAAADGVVRNAWGWAVPLPAGSFIGPGGQFAANPALAEASNYYGVFYSYGPWANVNDHYLGLRFPIGSDTHYGWVRMDVQTNVGSMSISATVKDWAYESTPNVGISAGDTGVVPEPGTLSLLALGSAGLALWRKRKTQSRAA